MKSRLISALAIVGILAAGGAAMAVNANVLSAASVDPGIVGSVTTVPDETQPMAPTTPSPDPSTGAGRGADGVVTPDDHGAGDSDGGSSPAGPSSEGASDDDGDDDSERSDESDPGDSDPGDSHDDSGEHDDDD